jgi:hypothetical protein
MILNEQEARTKVCPLMSKQWGNSYGSVESLCLASLCMKWRWAPNAGPEDMAWRKAVPEAHSPDPIEPKGYCGA